MDFIAHLIWSVILFAGPQVYWAIFVGAIPDLIPFGSFLIYRIFQPKRFSNKTQREIQNIATPSHIEFLQDSENRWVYHIYNYSHSLVIWGICTAIMFLIGWIADFRPWFMFAWLFHILMDIPTHTKEFFAPKFLTPLSGVRMDGISWAHPLIMVLNYLTIGILFYLRLQQYNLI